MHFAPDTEVVLEFAAVLANTVADASRSGADELAAPEQLSAMMRRFDYTGRFDRDARELAGVQQTRATVRTIWLLERDAAVVQVNRILREARALPFLARHDGYDWHLHGTDPDAPLAERILVEIGLALVDVIRTDEYGRLRCCAAPDCAGLLVDLSRNGSKQFCSIRCGNRMNMIAYRERAAAEAATP